MHRAKQAQLFPINPAVLRPPFFLWFELVKKQKQALPSGFHVIGKDLTPPWKRKGPQPLWLHSILGQLGNNDAPGVPSPQVANIRLHVFFFFFLEEQGTEKGSEIVLESPKFRKCRFWGLQWERIRISSSVLFSNAGVINYNPKPKPAPWLFLYCPWKRKHWKNNILWHMKIIWNSTLIFKDKIYKISLQISVKGWSFAIDFDDRGH